MKVTTFKEEGIYNDPALIIKSLFILTFKAEHPSTQYLLGSHPYAEQLTYLYNKLLDTNYLYLSAVNPVEYTFIAKQLVQPKNRLGVDEDFDKVNTELLLLYLQAHILMPTSISLN